MFISLCSSGGNAVKRGSAGKEAPGPPKLKQLSKEEIDVINEDWEDNQLTTMMWETISKNDIRELRAALKEGPELAHIRSEDGRGPMWWAHENGRTEIIEILKKLGVSEERTDEKGLRPLDISKR